MDKCNYTPTDDEYQKIRRNIRKFKNALAMKIEENGILKRHRKLKNAKMLADAICLMITNNLSFRALSEIMAVKYDVRMSDTAWEKQIEKCAKAFYNASTEIFLTSKNKANYKGQIYLVDASNIPEEGKKGVSIRLHCSYNLNRHDIDETYISDWRKAESLCNFNIHPDTLYIADRAYGKAGQMAYILSHNADFLIRITPNQICLYADQECVNKISFRDILQNSGKDRIGFPCYIRYRKTCYPIWIEASKIPDDKLDKVARRQKRLAQRKQRKFSEISGLFSKWVILATSIRNPHIDLLKTYASRWQIELLFKRSKTLFRFRRIKRGSQKYAIVMTHLWVALICFASGLSALFSLRPFDFFSIFATCFA